MPNIAKRSKRKKPKKVRYSLASRILIPLVLALISFLIYKTIYIALISNKILGVAINLNSAEIIALVNEKRQEEGLPALKPNEELSRAAQAKLSDMFVYEYWDHLSPSQNPPWIFILNAGYDYAFAGENLAKDYNDDKTLVDAWMESESHRANIMSSDFTDTAIIFGSGQVEGKETVLIVQMFGKAYTDQDYINAGVNPPREFSTQSQSLVHNQKLSLAALFDLFFSKNDFKILLFFIFGFFSGFILFQALTKSRKNKIAIMTLEKLKKKYWGRI